MLLGSAQIGIVAPIIVRPTLIVSLPSNTIAHTGPLLMSVVMIFYVIIAWIRAQYGTESSRLTVNKVCKKRLVTVFGVVLLYELSRPDHELKGNELETDSLTFDSLITLLNSLQSWGGIFLTSHATCRQDLSHSGMPTSLLVVQKLCRPCLLWPSSYTIEQRWKHQQVLSCKPAM